MRCSRLLTLTASLLLLASGCNTLTGEVSGPFGGTRSWIQTLRLSGHVIGGDAYGNEAYAVASLFGAVVDVPLCLALDTVALPFTLVSSLGHDPREERLRSLYNPRVVGGHGYTIDLDDLDEAADGERDDAD